MKRYLLIYSILSFSISLSWAQTALQENLDFENVIQQLLPQQELDIDYNDIYDRLFTLYLTPLDLNNAERSDFQSLFFLSDAQINGILDYREQYGDFRSIYELLTIDDFDQTTIEKLQNFIEIKSETDFSLSRAIKNPSVHELILRYQSVLEPKKGYSIPDTLSNGETTSRYLGDPGRIYARYLMARPDKYSFGFTIEKDPGEQLIWDQSTKRYGMDYYSFHALVENQWIFNKIVIGDFNLDFGQGLVFGSGISLGKGTEPVTTIRRNNLGLRPYRSVFESKDFSGIAAKVQINQINVNLFISNVFRDGRIYREDASGSEFNTFTRYINSVGLHRTPSEISSKHNVTDQSIGGNMNAMLFKKRLEIGLNGVYNRYNLNLFPDSTLYRIFNFRGKSNYNASGYVNYYFKNAHFFSEIAMSKGGGLAHSTGLIISLSSQVHTALHYRNYDTNYHAYTGNAFGENTISSNEKGFYWGISIKPLPKLLLTGYFDYFSFPWLKYRVDAPSVGWDYMVALQYDWNQKGTLRIQYRKKSKNLNHETESHPLPSIEAQNTSRLRLDFLYNMNSNFSFRSRIQNNTVHYLNTVNNGFLLAQDLTYKARNLFLTGRFSVFDASNYDSRLYIYERDLLYVYRVPSFFNRGVRHYVMCKWEIDKKIALWLKYSKTIYTNIDTIGTGLEEIAGNTRTDIGLQLRIKF